MNYKEISVDLLNKHQGMFSPLFLLLLGIIFIIYIYLILFIWFYLFYFIVYFSSKQQILSTSPRQTNPLIQKQQAQHSSISPLHFPDASSSSSFSLDNNNNNNNNNNAINRASLSHRARVIMEVLFQI